MEPHDERSIEERVAVIQARLRRYAPKRCLGDELIEDRRREAAEEELDSALAERRPGDR